MPSYTARREPDPRQQAALETRASHLGTEFADHPELVRLRAIVPFDNYALSGLDYPKLGVGAGVMLASDMPEAFLKAFLDQNLYRADPLAGAITPDKHWGSWHDLTPDILARPEVQPILDLQKAFGITTRTVVGFFRQDFRYGGATFTRATPFSDDEKLILEAVARMVHTKLSATYFERMAQHAVLSRGEIACLAAVAAGHTLDEAAAATGYSPETVTTYIKTASRKLETTNRTHAVAEAIRRGLIV